MKKRGQDQYLHEMTLIVYHSNEHKLQFDSRVAQLPSTNAHQCHTPAALSKACHEELGHTPFLHAKTCKTLQDILCILQRFASKWKFGLWCCNLNEYYAVAIYELWFHYFSAFPLRAILVDQEVLFLNNFTLFTIFFLVYRNDHNCLPTFWCFSKFPHNLTHPCQPT